MTKETNFTQEDFQKARRISKAIQEHLELINQDGLRSTDVYPVLARKDLVQKDRHQGIHFRSFLNKLRENGMLKQLIPQCHFQHSKSDSMEWYFYRSNSLPKEHLPDGNSQRINSPSLTDSEIDELIEEAKPHIDKLPIRDTSDFTPQMKETRKNYPRAYEIWTPREIEIMERAFKKFNKIDKVAELLRRQPSAVRTKLKSLPFLSE